jgi:hypothetical protein
MLVLSDQTLQIVYLETAYRAQMQKILPSNQIVAKKLQHIFQLIKIQSIAHYILYGLHELFSAFVPDMPFQGKQFGVFDQITLTLI